MHCKVSAYADDLMFSLSKPANSLPALMREFDAYGQMSNLKINFSKSEAMGLGMPQPMLSRLKTLFHFKWTDVALKYLGTSIPSDMSCLFKLNFPPPSEGTEGTSGAMDRWPPLMVRTLQHPKDVGPSQVPLPSTGHTDPSPSGLL